MWLEPSEQRRVVDVDINSSRCCYQDVSFFFFLKNRRPLASFEPPEPHNGRQ